MFHTDDIVIEMARATREGLARAIERHQAQNKGEDYAQVLASVQNGVEHLQVCTAPRACP